MEPGAYPRWGFCISTEDKHNPTYICGSLSTGKAHLSTVICSNEKGKANYGKSISYAHYEKNHSASTILILILILIVIYLIDNPRTMPYYMGQVVYILLPMTLRTVHTFL